MTGLPAASTALELARARGLLKRITSLGPLAMCAAEYRALRRAGYSRADVNRAIDSLVAAGEIEIATTMTGTVCVRAWKRKAHE